MADDEMLKRRVDVVLEVEELPDGHRVHMIGVFRPGDDLPPQKYDHRNVVQTWIGVDLDARAFMVFRDSDPAVTEPLS